MSLRRTIQELDKNGNLLHITQPISTQYEIAGVIKRFEPQPVIFENVSNYPFRVVGNLFPSKQAIAHYLDIAPNDIIPTNLDAIEHPSQPTLIKGAPCQEIVHFQPNLNDLPILRHFPSDGGHYITSGVFITRHPEYGQNADFHRAMQFSPTEMAIRVVRSRHFDTFLQDLGKVDVAICIGNGANVLMAAATSVAIGFDELTIANALEPLRVVKAKTVDLLIPADCEFVIEGTVYRNRRHAEGPFVDLTETLDIIRQEPVFEVKAITHRKDAIWQALLPGGLEHKVLMGMPREPTIFREVNKTVHCLDVNVNPGGCSWLHAIVQIDKQSEEDGFKAIRAAFAGHRSCKHVFVVDSDIDIYNPLEVEWALATRFQGDRDMLILDREPGSSLDPSADTETRMTTKIGFDLTAPVGKARQHFEKVPYPEIDISTFLASATKRVEA
ncbi:MAG: UbiD family decarboxylase [Anaerolineales bacterium]|nr:UbiD family decarboxylase [Anaerolineales bacterium]